jgi:electron transfer flavoprotein alpha subunit
VFIETTENGVSEASLQLLGKGRELADKLETYLAGIMLGYNIRHLWREQIYYGADKVILVDDKSFEEYEPVHYAYNLALLAKKHKPEIILVPATRRGREIGPYTANTLRTGITADCTGFDIDPKTRDLIQIRPPFGAWMLAHIKTPRHRPQLATARPNTFPVPEKDENRKGELVEEKLLSKKNGLTRLVKRIPIQRKEETPIEKADFIVAGGKGIGSKEGFKLLEELAKEIHGVTAGSRKAVDAGWIPYEKQVGQTGKSVHPLLYIAVGISGASQHVFGIREAKIVVAINNDPEAPIFKHADYGIVGDYKEIVPILIKKIREYKQRTKKSV